MMQEYKKCGHKRYHEPHLFGADPLAMDGGDEFACLGYDDLWGKEDV
jgi:hypothetical protein